MAIHTTAIIDTRAEIDPTADIGPYVVIDGPVLIGPRVKIHAHACLAGWTRIGQDCEIYPYASIGHAPQDHAYDGSETYCTVGDGTVVREGVSIHRGTGSGSTTSVGKMCFLMANSHVAHNCCVGDRVILANGVLLGGHVHIGDRTFLGGAAGVHQFTRVGEVVMIGAMGKITSDVPSFFMAGENNRCLGVNAVGMRRAGLTVEERNEIRRAHQLLYRSGILFSKAVDELANVIATPAGMRLLEFLRMPSKRGYIPARRSRSQSRGASCTLETR